MKEHTWDQLCVSTCMYLHKHIQLHVYHMHKYGYAMHMLMCHVHVPSMICQVQMIEHSMIFHTLTKIIWYISQNASSVCVVVSVCVCVWVWTCLCVSMWKSCALLLSLFTFVLWQGLWLNLELATLTKQAVSLPSCAGVPDVYHAWLFCVQGSIWSLLLKFAQ